LWDGEQFLGLVFVERKFPPVGIALVGGFVEVGERVEDAAVREAREEVNLEVVLRKVFGVYSDPHRDPRGHTVTVVYVADAQGEPKGGSDAKKAVVFPLEKIPWNLLVFDHKRIVQDYLRHW
jgi:8-oxo-dGTP diphosphatase